MALGSSNITMSAVNTELGSPYSPAQDMLLSVLAPHANAGNIASFYGTGTLVVDSNKNVSWVAPTSDYKLGDFRNYNASAAAPAASNNFTHNYPPTGSSDDIDITTLPQQFNILFVDSGAQYIYYRGYLTTANRTAETSPYKTQISSWLYNTITALSGHTRTQTEQIQHPHTQTLSSVSIPMPATPNDYLYLDTFFCNSGGSRLVNLGNAVANGYTTITMHQQQYPTILNSGTGPTPYPSGYTVIHPVIASTSGNCLDDSPIPYGGTIGGTNITFYVGMHGVYGLTTRNLAATNFTIRISYDGSTKDVNTGTLYSSTKKYVSTTLPGSKTWEYDKNATITIVSCTYGSYTTCP